MPTSPEAYKKWLSRNYERKRAKEKAWIAANKDRVRRKQKAWVAANRERVRGQKAKSQKKNPASHSAAENRKRARHKGCDKHHTISEWETVKLFAGYRCLACFKEEPEIKLTRDHVIPMTKGGADTIDNIQPLCGACNSAKSTRIIDYRF